MYFKSLELARFNSLAQRTVIALESRNALTGGASGCDDARVSDAIRWVLGEQNAGGLGGNTAEKVAFAGAAQPEALDGVEVCLTLGGARGSADNKCDEVTVSRRLSRSGESQYFLNEHPCCLADIQNLFVANGLHTRVHPYALQSSVEVMLARAWLEVDLDEIADNVHKLKAAAGPDTRLLAMVKADGYGCGAEMVSRAALESGADMLGVATVPEAVSLRERGLDCPILIFGSPHEDELETVIEEGLTQTVFDLSLARQLDSAARKCQKKAKVHLEVDTGMGKVGILPREMDSFLDDFAACHNIVLDGVYTHFPVADRDRRFTQQQVELFMQALGKIRGRGYEIPLVHVANTAALLNRFCELFDMVRTGISIYGLYGSPLVSREVNLEETVSFKARVVHVKRLLKGESVSYGREFIAPRETNIATIAAGYADGLPFRLGNAGDVLVRGRRFPIVGRVTMDMTMIDLGDLTEIEVGDEAVIIGQSGQEHISVSEVARKAGTIEYEVLCGIGPRVPRVYIRNGQIASIQTYSLA